MITLTTKNSPIQLEISEIHEHYVDYDGISTDLVMPIIKLPKYIEFSQMFAYRILGIGKGSGDPFLRDMDEEETGIQEMEAHSYKIACPKRYAVGLVAGTAPGSASMITFCSSLAAIAIPTAGIVGKSVADAAFAMTLVTICGGSIGLVADGTIHATEPECPMIGIDQFAKKNTDIQNFRLERLRGKVLAIEDRLSRVPDLSGLERARLKIVNRVFTDIIGFHSR